MKLAEDPSYPLILRLQSLLEQIPIIEKVKIIGDGPSMDEGVDYLIQVRIDKTTYVLACETKNNGQPRFVRSAIKTLRSYGRCEQVPDMRSSYSSGAHPRGTS